MKNISILTLVALAAVNVGCKGSSKNDVVPDEQPHYQSLEPPQATQEGKKRSVVDDLLEMKSFDEAVSFAKPFMIPKFGETSQGAQLLAIWSVSHDISWSDVSITPGKSMTSFSKVMKDQSEELGKHMCVAGFLIQIEVKHLSNSKVADGLLMDEAERLYSFSALGSSGDLVAKSSAKFCGVVTGRFDYSNSGGGAGHAVELVGMFDLKENKR